MQQNKEINIISNMYFGGEKCTLGVCKLFKDWHMS